MNAFAQLYTPSARNLTMALVILAMLANLGAAQESELAQTLRELDGDVLPPNSGGAKELRAMLGRQLRARRDSASRRETAAWKAIHTKEDWETFRDPRIEALGASLGHFPAAPAKVNVRVDRQVATGGITITNFAYESRPGLWVTANLYDGGTPAAKMPGLIICHSHHNPKTQGELQDMGMTWARQGCLVLIMDQLGHGERRQHPFTDAGKYPGSFRVGRQDYYFRYNVGIQLHLIGDSLMGWMVRDIMRGVDVLLDRKSVDPGRIIVLGAVAGGGDPCAVAAALDRRIAAAVPFNFGGPQPETRYPLPADAEDRFNYAGGGSWESTRNLRLSCRDGFMPWVIVGALAPRGLLYGHEFAWDRDADPVWRRLQKIYGFYDAGNRLAFAAGSGSVRGKPPESTHCNNIGPVHRKQIYAAFDTWFRMPVPEEYRKHVAADTLACADPRVKPVLTLVRKAAAERADGFRAGLARLPPNRRPGELQRKWRDLLGEVNPQALKVVSERKEHHAGVEIRRILLRTAAGSVEQAIDIPMLMLIPVAGTLRVPLPAVKTNFATVVGIAQAGKQAFLKQRAETIARLLSAGVSVCLPDLRGTGATRPADDSRARNSAATALSSTELMLGGTLLGSRLSDLRSVIAYLVTTTADPNRLALWGDSFAPVNAADARLEVPLDAAKLPPGSEPLGGLLAVLGALYEPGIRAVYARGGLASYASVLDSPFCYLPYDIVVPGALTAGDLGDVAAALSPRPLRLEGMLTGLNQRMPAAALEQTYRAAFAAYRDHAGRVRVSETPAGQKELADWLVGQLK